jgi:two-component system chemotaxis response regulator CheB
MSSSSTNVVPEIIAIGASTGGPKALEHILAALPGDLPAPIVVVQHMPPRFTDALAKRLDGMCELRVHEARQGEQLRPGTVYFAPGGKQMTIFSGGRDVRSACLSDSPTDTLHKPSVDVMMLSVAEVFGSDALGVILTGMGSDGVKGMTAIRKAGGITLGQDEATSAVYGMPRVCAERGVLQKILPLDRIAEEIVALFPRRAATLKSHAAAAGGLSPR